VREVGGRHHDIGTASLVESWILKTEPRTWFLFESSRRGNQKGHRRVCVAGSQPEFWVENWGRGSEEAYWVKQSLRVDAAYIERKRQQLTKLRDELRSTTEIAETDESSANRDHSVHVLEVSEGAIGSIVAFLGPLGPALFQCGSAAPSHRSRKGNRKLMPQRAAQA
jgi:hypothetical protein